MKNPNSPSVRTLFRIPALVALFSVVAAGTSLALPRFSLQTGATCASCHANLTGGGPRTQGGWASMKDFALISPRETFLAPLFESESNDLIPGVLSWGFDFRSQVAKRPDEHTGKLERRFFTMQASPYVTYRPVEELSAYATYNLVKAEYPSQQDFYAGIVFQPSDMIQVQAGYLQPNFGVRHDDHTTFTRIRGGIGYYPYYAEAGGEIYVTPLEWLTVSGGVYSSKNRNDYVDSVSSSGAFYTGNLSFMVPDYDTEIIYKAGVSAAMYDTQSLLGGHIGIGWLDKASILAEYVQRADDFTRALPGATTAGPTYKQTADVFLIQASVEVIDGLSFVARYEEAKTNTAERSDGGPESHSIAKQWVAGFQVFVLPFVELRPEYRWYDDQYIRLAQYTAQLHIFY